MVRPDGRCTPSSPRATRRPALGLLVDTLAVTGARPAQATRLRIEDLHDHPTKPHLMMSKCGKGGGRNRSKKKPERYCVPITTAAAMKSRRRRSPRARRAIADAG